ncbi:MAG: tetratricopeptide repeat protein [Kiritimatiellae bacterium]|nr:tetratricopeptide repeat protein [Kiritimatiellia bacterium]MDD4736543.1 tetratricopeptide repeat protein [Kiritimatiellia bacterium]
MKQRPQHIYDHIEDPFTDEPDHEGVDYWNTERRRNRLRNFLWLLIFTGVAAAIIYVIIMNNQKSRIEEENVLFGSRFTPDEQIISFRQTSRQNTDIPAVEIVLNELQEINPLELPEKGGAPLTPAWIKQVTHYLIVAQQSENAGQYQKALEQYNKALAIFPNLEQVNARRGMLYLQLEQYGEAIHSFKEALTESEVDPEVINNLGSCYMALEQYSRAEKCFRKALNMNPNLSSARLNLATTYMKSERNAQATEAFEAYISNNPNDLKAIQAFASLLLDDGDWRKAAELLMQVQRKAPEIGPVYFKLGEALAHSEDKQAAVETLRKGVLLVDPKQALGWLAGERYNLLRNEPTFQKLVNDLSSSNK